MTLSDITNRISFLTNTTTSEYTAANRLISLNKWYQMVHSWILQSHDEINFDDSNKTDLPILTTNLVADQTSYALPSETIIIRRAEITYDGSNWKKLEPFDISERSSATDTTSVTADFSTNNPYYDIQANCIFLYPPATSNVTSGLKLWLNRSVTEFTSDDVTTGTKSPGFDINFHDILALGVAFDWTLAKGGSNKNDLWVQIQDYERRIKQHYGRKQEDRIMKMKPAYVNYN